MTQRFNVPPGWPVPFGWTPPPDWEPDPAWPPAPAGWQFWVEDGATPGVGTRSESAAGKRLVVLGTVGAVLLVVLAGAAVMFLHNRGNDAAKSPTASVEAPDEAWKTLPSTASPAVPTLPAGAVVCGVRAGGRYQGAARGTESTSCPFVENVRDALNNAGGQVPSVVDAYSPVTGMHYQMSCAMEQVVTCRGGKNAVVYVYEVPASADAPPAADPAAPGPGANTPESVVTLPDPEVDLYTPSGIRCQIYARSQLHAVSQVACSHTFPKAPRTFGPATGVAVSETGEFEWMYGNMGQPRPKVTIEPGHIYRLSGWSIVADGGDTRFSNDGTGKGMAVNIHDAYPITVP